MANQIVVQEKRQFSRIAFDATGPFNKRGWYNCNSTLLDISLNRRLDTPPGTLAI